MLVIRNEQIDELAKRSRTQFVEEMVSHWKTNFAKQVAGASDDALRKRVEGGIVKAEASGITTRYDVRRYLEFAVTHGDDFEVARRTAWAGTILRDESLTGTEKMNRIDAHEMFSLRGF